MRMLYINWTTDQRFHHILNSFDIKASLENIIIARSGRNHTKKEKEIRVPWRGVLEPP